MIKASDLMKKNDNFDRDAMEDYVCSNEYIGTFIRQNNLSHEQVEEAMVIFLNFIDDSIFDEYGRYESKQYPGYKMVLSIKSGRVEMSYSRCDDKTKYLPENLKSIAVPEEQKMATLSDFSLLTEQRRTAHRYARLFINNFGEEDNKGLYISGMFRSGKSYLAAAIGREIAEKGKTVLMVYYPELSSILKGLIGSPNFQETVESLKDVDLLILDDFGGDSISPLIRDEVLGVVLQYRMVKKLPIIITSNINMSRLADTCLRKDGSEGEQIKALRIVERIKEMTAEIFLTDRFKENSF